MGTSARRAGARTLSGERVRVTFPTALKLAPGKRTYGAFPPRPHAAIPQSLRCSPAFMVPPVLLTALFSWDAVSIVSGEYSYIPQHALVHPTPTLKWLRRFGREGCLPPPHPPQCLPPMAHNGPHRCPHSSPCLSCSLASPLRGASTSDPALPTSLRLRPRVLTTTPATATATAPAAVEAGGRKPPMPGRDAGGRCPRNRRCRPGVSWRPLEEAPRANVGLS